MEIIKNAELLRTGYVYPTGFMYPLEEVQHVLREDGGFQYRIKAGALRGERGQPQKPTDQSEGEFASRVLIIDETRVSHVIEKVWIDERGVVRGDVRPIGPYGQMLADSEEPTFVLRGMMTLLNPINGVMQPKPGTMHIVTFDWVKNPHTEKPWPDNPLEG